MQKRSLAIQYLLLTLQISIYVGIAPIEPVLLKVFAGLFFGDL